GPDQDKDLDDSATISFYIDYDSGAQPTDGLADYGSLEAQAIIDASATTNADPDGVHLIYSGLLEDPEGKSDSYYAWDIKADNAASGWYPYDQAFEQSEIAAVRKNSYHIYAIIDENKTGGTKRVVGLGAGLGIDHVLTAAVSDLDDIDFETSSSYSSSYAQIIDPPIKNDVVDEAETYRINFNVFDFNSGGTDSDVGLFLVKADASIDGVVAPMTTIIGDATAANGLYGLANGEVICITDDDGDPAAGSIWLSAQNDTYYDLTLHLPTDNGDALGETRYTDDLNGSNTDVAGDTEYYVYIGVDDGSYNSVEVQVVTLANIKDSDGDAFSTSNGVGEWVVAENGASGIVTAITQDGAPDGQLTILYSGINFEQDAAFNTIHGGRLYDPATVAGDKTTIDNEVETAVAAKADFLGGIIPLYRSPGTITFVNVDTVAPQKNLLLTPSNIVTTVGDTTTVNVAIADEGSDVDFIDVYIAVEKDYFDIVSSNAPFTLASSGINAGTDLIANQPVEDDADNGRWILHGTLFNSGSAIDPTTDDDLGSTALSFQVVCKGTSNAEEATTSIYFVNEPASGWVTQFKKAGNDLSFGTVNNTVSVQPRGIVEGIVVLEGRDTSAYQVTFELRERDSYVSSTDATLLSENDADSDTDGIQYTLDSDGKFSLFKMPTGDWDLAVMFDKYLSKLQEIDIVPGLDTLFVSFGTLLGGDCVGYTDGSGNAYPNNTIDQTDVDRIADAYLSTSDSTKWDTDVDPSTGGLYNYQWADINGDGVVEAEDLTMATANISEDGAPPVYQKSAVLPAASNFDALVEFMGVPSELKAGNTYSIQVIVRNAANVKGYSIAMDYDTEALTFAGINKGDFLENESYFFPTMGENTVGLVNAVYGQASYTGDGILAEVDFTAKRDGMFSAEMLGITKALIVNSDFMKENVVVDNSTGLSLNDAPVVFEMNQNFPNPFNPTTLINFSLPENSSMSLKVFDILGRHIRTLAAGEYAAGNYSIMWDATNMNGNAVSAGVYFYTIQAGNYHSTKRMLLLK
ncbi:FlgD immunoglobulin-like domain containing protein, partial [Candidatus Latescibacterota bacterium]